jgi:hypothetical protein
VDRRGGHFQVADRRYDFAPGQTFAPQIDGATTPLSQRQPAILLSYSWSYFWRLCESVMSGIKQEKPGAKNDHGRHPNEDSLGH